MLARPGPNGPYSPTESKGPPPGLTGVTLGSPMMALVPVSATTSDRPLIAPRTASLPPATGGEYSSRVPSMPLVSSTLATSARSAVFAPAWTVTTASTPMNRLIIDSSVRSLRARMPCSPMMTAERSRPESLIRGPREIVSDSVGCSYRRQLVLGCQHAVGQPQHPTHPGGVVGVVGDQDQPAVTLGHRVQGVDDE